MSNLEAVLQSDAFDMFSGNDKEEFKKLLSDLQGKNAAESMQLIMAFQNKMPNKKLSQEEQTKMLAAVMSTLSEADKTKFNGILKMLEMMKK